MKVFLSIFIFLLNSLFAFEKLNSENFENKVSNGNFIVNFHAPWCNVCQKANENLKEFKTNSKNDIKIYRVDISEEVQLTNKHNALSVPVFVYIKNGKIISKESGIKDVERIQDSVNRYFH